jgi:hypothetical protein
MVNVQLGVADWLSAVGTPAFVGTPYCNPSSVRYLKRGQGSPHRRELGLVAVEPVNQTINPFTVRNEKAEMGEDYVSIY